MAQVFMLFGVGFGCFAGTFPMGLLRFGEVVESPRSGLCWLSSFRVLEFWWLFGNLVRRVGSPRPSSFESPRWPLIGILKLLLGFVLIFAIGRVFG